MVAWVTSASALGLTTIIFLLSAYFIGRESLRTGVKIQASILADNLTAAISFK